MIDYPDILRLCGGAIMALVCIRILQTYDKSGIVALLSVTVSVVFAIAAFSFAKPVLTYLSDTASVYLKQPFPQLLGRGIGIGVTVQLTSDIVREAGASAIADKLDFAGKAALLSIGMPLYKELFTLAATLLGV